MSHAALVRSLFVVVAVSAATFAVSCNTKSYGPPSGPSAGPVAAATGADASGQVTRGRGHFARHCAGCHGASGEGKSAPRLIGAGALPTFSRPPSKYRRNEFHTAKDVADFAMAEMPPGLLSKPPPEHYWAILAYVVSANGVALSEPLGPANAGSVALRR